LIPAFIIGLATAVIIPISVPMMPTMIITTVIIIVSVVRIVVTIIGIISAIKGVITVKSTVVKWIVEPWIIISQIRRLVSVTVIKWRIGVVTPPEVTVHRIPITVAITAAIVI